MNYEKIKSVVLFVLVMTSLALTWSIWNYKPSYETITDGSTDIVTEVDTGEKRTLSDLLLPSKLLVHQEGAYFGTSSEKELNHVMREIGSWTLYQPINVSSLLSETDFQQLVEGDKHINVLFETDIPFQTAQALFSFNGTAAPNAVFNRIVIQEGEQGDKANVYFISMNERLVFKSQAEAVAFSSFQERYTASSQRLDEYDRIDLAPGRTLYVLSEPPLLTTKNYLPEQIDADVFKRALFSDPSYVRRGSSSTGSEEYTDGSSFMRMNSVTSMMRYVNSAETTQSIPLNQLVEQSIRYVNDHTGWVDDYRLFKAQSGSPAITYRLFLTDYPVFNASGLAEISQIWGRDRIYQYDRSAFVIQIDDPIPEYGTKYALRNGREAVEAILDLDNIDPAGLTDVRIGYEMTLEREAPKILTMKPAWYYCYNGNWSKLPIREGSGDDGLE